MKLRIGLSVSVALTALLPGAVRADAPVQQEMAFEKKITKTVRGRYLLGLPKEYGKDKSKKWALLLFLHGSGERGDNLDLVKKHGPPKLIAQGKDLPFIVVSPQCPNGEGWSTETLNALLDTVIKKYAVDESRIYCTGLSMGGYGTWALATEYPERFAAIAPICGGGAPRRAAKIKDIPTWVFHGAKDEAVPLSQSQEMVDALKAAGGNVKFTIYPDAGHDSWTETYDNPAFFEWLLQQRKPAKSVD